MITRNGTSSFDFHIHLIALFVVPAIPYDTLTQLQESSEHNDSSDYFQSVGLDKVQFIEEVFHSPVSKQTAIAVESFDDSEDIPDIEDFEDQNLLITNDPV